MKIYALTRGSYSDYHIEAMFSSKEKAQAFATIANMTDAHFEEHDVDPEIPQELKHGLYPYSIEISIESGVVYYCQKLEFWTYMRPARILHKGIDFSCWAKDEEHATKIASEIRAEYIANPQSIRSDQ